MPVYVDRAVFKPGKPRMCRMVADTDAELYSMVESMGIRKRRVRFDLGTPHYDLCKHEREAAVELGAVEVSCTSLSAALAKLTALAPSSPPREASHR